MSSVSIVICTYQREFLLTDCINSITPQIKKGDFEILVINNDNNHLINQYSDSLKVKVVNEEQIGLSHTRNRGFLESKYDWLFFIDDDAKLVEGGIEQIIHTIENYDFSMFTGIWKEWYMSPPPKWLPHSTGNYMIKGSNQIREIGDDYVSGGVMIIKKSVLEEVGGFPTNLGMTGNKIAYGEETYVEQKVKELGYKVGINPNIVIEHLVGEHKYTLKWHLDSAFAKGRDNQIISPLSKSTIWIKLIIATFFGWIKPCVKLIVKKKYYWQNWVIDYYGNLKYLIGQISA